MSLIARIVLLVVLLPVAIILIMLSVANRQDVTMALDPFTPDNPAFSLTGPLFLYLFAALILGLILGSAATWVAQGKYRKKARHRKYEASLWQDEAQRAKAVRPAESSDTNRSLTLSNTN